MVILEHRGKMGPSGKALELCGSSFYRQEHRWSGGLGQQVRL